MRALLVLVSYSACHTLASDFPQATLEQFWNWMEDGVDPHVIVISETEPELNLHGIELQWTSETDQDVTPETGHELNLDEAELAGPGEASLASNRTLLSALVSPNSSA